MLSRLRFQEYANISVLSKIRLSFHGVMTMHTGSGIPDHFGGLVLREDDGRRRHIGGLGSLCGADEFEVERGDHWGRSRGPMILLMPWLSHLHHVPALLPEAT